MTTTLESLGEAILRYERGIAPKAELDRAFGLAAPELRRRCGYRHSTAEIDFDDILAETIDSFYESILMGEFRILDTSTSRVRTVGEILAYVRQRFSWRCASERRRLRRLPHDEIQEQDLVGTWTMELEPWMAKDFIARVVALSPALRAWSGRLDYLFQGEDSARLAAKQGIRVESLVRARKRLSQRVRAITLFQPTLAACAGPDYEQIAQLVSGFLDSLSQHDKSLITAVAMGMSFRARRGSEEQSVPALKRRAAEVLAALDDHVRRAGARLGTEFSLLLRFLSREARLPNTSVSATVSEERFDTEPTGAS